MVQFGFKKGNFSETPVEKRGCRMGVDFRVACKMPAKLSDWLKEKVLNLLKNNLLRT